MKANGFTYKEVDVSRDSRALADMIKKTGQQGVPQTGINGQAVVGFDKDKLDRLLSKTK